MDHVAQRPRSWRSNRLVLPGIDLREHPKFDTEEKINSRPTTLWLRNRRLEDADTVRTPIFPMRISPVQNLGAERSAAWGRSLQRVRRSA